MAENVPDIVIVERRLTASELARLVHLFFGDMVVDTSVRDRVREITFELIGRGEALE
jgi:hypothetical protein